MSEKDKSVALEIVETINKTAISLAVCRHGLIREGEDDECTLPDEAEDEIIKDVLDCLTGEETGCLDPEELDAENCALLMVQDRLATAHRDEREAGFNQAIAIVKDFYAMRLPDFYEKHKRPNLLEALESAAKAGSEDNVRNG